MYGNEMGGLDLIYFFVALLPPDTLQESIGIAVVMREGHARPDIKTIQKHAAISLHPSKWPQVPSFGMYKCGLFSLSLK